ncbi:MAG: tRNA pseudouridine(55) synthase TruB [Clostridiales bacterium]|nr:tRNA pseudouridine(55) synthase TruB [Clostridiales bacterium]
MDGLLNVYKEKGYTSHDVVAKLRGILHQKKIGHTGTLDPDATGVLPVCLGKATKVCELLSDKEKSYQAVLQLGITTDTQDLSGTVLSRKEFSLEVEKVRQALFSFVGDYDQIPPMYSAIKINGKKLYELARQGKEVERKARRVQIHHIEIRSMDLKKGQVVMDVTCSKGTYIRTLCHDIGEKLGCGGAMAELVRTRVGTFRIQDAYSLDEIAQFVKDGKIKEYVMPVDGLFEHLPKVVIKKEYGGLIYNGNPFLEKHILESVNPCKTGQIRVYDSEDHFVGIYQYQLEKKCFWPVKMFL